MKLIFITLVVIVGIASFSCRTPRYVYAPAPPNNPFFQKKGDSKLAGYYSGNEGNSNIAAVVSTGRKSNGFDMQAAYAITNHWAVTAAVFSRKEEDVFPNKQSNIFDSSVVNYKRSIIEFGGGYFVPLNHQKTITFNLYGGMGLGRFIIDDAGKDANGSLYARNHKSGIIKWYIQPGLNFMLSEYFKFSLLLGRLSFVHYANIKTNYTDDELKYFYLDKISNQTLAFLEPGTSIQIGIPQLPWLKIDGSVTLTSALPDNYPNVRWLNGSIGLSFDFSKSRKTLK